MNDNNQSDSLENESDLEAEQQELEALELASALRRAEYYQYIDKISCYTGGLTGQCLVPIACCVLHNFIRSQGRGDSMFREYENEDMLIDREGDREGEGRQIPNIDLSSSNVALMSNIRDEIAKKKCG
ncbi:hypothetical protein Dsin_004543 [Dipteronia sinensis]|uniref:Uncharacterized protein n=1 Tax=Dipteronia sinensis TaxID=43782 RepID=A0AAE0AUS0_9ROSI|nr:hypothetical protein Dsin_004543 [Dipteronia sinensis]